MGKGSLPLEGFQRWGSQLQGFGTPKNTGYSRELKTQMDQENTRRDQSSGNKIFDSSWTYTILQEEVGVRREKVGEEVLVGREGEMGAYLTSGRTGHSSSSVLSLEILATSSVFKRAVLYGVWSSLLRVVGEVGCWEGGAGLVPLMPLSVSSTKVAVAVRLRWRPSRLRRWRWILPSAANWGCPMKWSCLCCRLHTRL